MRLIDADALLKGRTDHEMISTHLIWNAPTVDAMEVGVKILGDPEIRFRKVVLCKDCKWRGRPGCAVTIVDESDEPKDDDFCSWGERREDELSV